MFEKLERRDPINLLVPERLDIVVKYLYIKSKIENTNFQHYKELYIRHILKRTGGNQYIYEYKNGIPVAVSKKISIQDYLHYFDELIESFQTKGFKSEYFIPVSIKNNILLDGAHRAACSIFFNLKPYIVNESRSGRSWDYNWFNENGFNKDELNEIINTYYKLKNDNTFSCILWGPLKKQWDNIEKEISSEHKIIMARNFTFTERTFEAIVHDIYSEEFGTNLPDKINKKIAYLKNYPLELRFLLIHVNRPEYINQNKQRKVCRQILEMKEYIRDRCNDIVEKNKFITIHASDNKEHTEHMKNIFLNRNNINYIKLRRNNIYRNQFLKWLTEFENVLKGFDISKEECCIVGSGPLEVIGIRNSTDIDFILISEKREVMFDNKSKSLSKNVDLVHKGYHEYNNFVNPISDDEIIKNPKYHFHFRGFKFANINIIRDRKDNHRRPKDLLDVQLIDNFFDLL